MSDFIRIQTPESVDLAFEPVGLGSRFLAALIDSLIQGLAGLAIVLVALFAGLGINRFALLQGIVLAILLLVGGLLLALYKLLFEALWNSQTPGKRIARIRV